MLQKGVDVNFVSQRGEQAINEAMSENRMDIVKYLLTQKIQPIALNSTPEKPLFNPPLCAAVSGKKTGSFWHVDTMTCVITSHVYLTDIFN